MELEQWNNPDFVKYIEWWVLSLGMVTPIRNSGRANGGYALCGCCGMIDVSEGFDPKKLAIAIPHENYTLFCHIETEGGPDKPDIPDTTTFEVVNEGSPILTLYWKDQ